MLIVDMKMPKRCFDCPMHDWTYGQHETRQNMLVCNARHELEPILCREIPNGDERPEWCPIKGVLPEEHGDLIDRDETFHAAQPQGCTDEHWAETTLGRVVLGAKTVIAAERKDDEQIH